MSGNRNQPDYTDSAQTVLIQGAAGGTATVTGGKLDVNASIDTTGLATSTKQSDGTQKSQIVDGSGNVIGATSNALDVNIKSGGSGGGAVTVADGADVTLGAKADAKSTATDTTPVTVMQVLKEISYMEQSPASRAVTNAGTFAVQTAGDIAHDSSDSGSPVKVGYQAKTSLTGITLVADADRTNAYAGEDGVPYVRDVPANPSSYSQKATTIASSTSDTDVLGSTPGAGVRFYLTDIMIYNSSATSTRVSIKDGSAGTVLAILPAPTLGGVSHTYKVPLRFTANTAPYAACADSVASVYVSITGYASKV